MPRNILVSGADGLLGMHLAARLLVLSDDVIHCLIPGTVSAEEINNAIIQLAARIKRADASGPIALAPRIAVHCLDPDTRDFGLPDLLSQILPVLEIWFLPSGRYSDRNYGRCGDAALLAKLLEALPAAETFNLVTGPGEADKRYLNEKMMVERCTAQGMNWRIFRASLLVGENLLSAHTSRDGFLQFLGALHEIKAEIEERIAEYFEFHALRCCLGDSDAELNILPVEDAAQQILQVARGESKPGAEYRIAAARGTRIMDLLDTVGMAYELSVLPVEDRGSMNAIDRDFDERIAEFRSTCASMLKPASSEVTDSSALPAEELEFDEERQQELFASVRASQDRARAKWSAQCANVLSLLQQRTIPRNGFDLTYYVSDSQGIPVVCLNAIGQGLNYWYRLIPDLSRYHKIIIWEPRGTVSPPPPFGLKEQLEDLEAVLRHEEIHSCHFATWCTGPKVAVDFYLQSPEAVLSIACLNSTFKCFGAAEELDTEYEHNFEPLCRVLREHPNMAPSVMKSLQSGEEEPVNLLEETDSDELSQRVLALMNKDLKPHVRAPFQTAAGILNYAHQIHDFWSWDIAKKAATVKVPVLLVSAEHDKVASPASSQMAAQLFPQSQLIHVLGATHYCMYDRPHFVAELLETFFMDSARLRADFAEREAVACTS